MFIAIAVLALGAGIVLNAFRSDQEKHKPGAWIVFTIIFGFPAFMWVLTANGLTLPDFLGVVLLFGVPAFVLGFLFISGLRRGSWSRRVSANEYHSWLDEQALARREARALRRMARKQH